MDEIIAADSAVDTVAAEDPDPIWYLLTINEIKR
jgi:hypothetical protein